MSTLSPADPKAAPSTSPPRAADPPRVPNLAPFSFFGLVVHDPGIVMFSCVKKFPDESGRPCGDTLQVSDES